MAIQNSLRYLHKQYRVDPGERTDNDTNSLQEITESPPLDKNGGRPREAMKWLKEKGKVKKMLQVKQELIDKQMAVKEKKMLRVAYDKISKQEELDRVERINNSRTYDDYYRLNYAQITDEQLRRWCSKSELELLRQECQMKQNSKERGKDDYAAVFFEQRLVREGKREDTWNDPKSKNLGYKRYEDLMGELRQDHARQAVEIGEMIQESCNTYLDHNINKKVKKKPVMCNIPMSQDQSQKE